MNVLSLFDGMSCGQLALNRAGITYDNYYASEIDKYAIKVTMANFPNTIQLGDVRNIKGSDLPKIDLLIGGSPCQGFSFAGKQLNFEDPRSKLFFEYVRLLKETNPRYFLLENVRMKKDSQDIISRHLGVEPIMIDSALVSAQSRKRLYWTNIPNVCLPKDRNLLFEHIIDYSLHGDSSRLDKVLSWNRRNVIQRTKDKKARTIQTRDSYNTFLSDLYRYLIPLEYERLQTVTEGYTAVEGISKTQRVKMLGNGWTVDVIAHIFSFMEFVIDVKKAA